jgi:type VI secretion system secreted protein VgrG
MEAALNGNYRVPEYTVQYRETDLNFIQRLLEEEGIYYFFKHEEGKQTLVLADSATAHATIPGYESILYLPKEHKMVVEEEHFWSLRVAGALFPGDYTTVRGYDYNKRRPAQLQFGKKPSQAAQPGEDFEDYDYPGGLSEEADATEESRLRMQADVVANTLIEVEGNTLGLGVGNLVKLRKPLAISTDANPFWSGDDFNKEYLITSATYAISVNQYETGDVADADEPYTATYTLLDSHTQFRPQRTASKPRIEGPQTALVVGPAGDEIHTDKFGRVKLQFDWDRRDTRNEKSSCWVRVAQVWAGKQWGAIHIPRIGHEVMVEFLDGDPDRPIVTGRLYNTDCMPPYDLPKNQTQSGIKSHSSKGGSDSNFNEIRFEDLKGKEELHMQAELDMSTNVKRNQTLYVGGDQSITIHGNQTVSVHGTDEKTGKKLPVQSVTSVTGKHTFDASDTIKIQAPTSITLECGGSTLVMVPGSITLTAGGGSKLVLDANALTQASGGGKTLHDANVLHQASGGGKILLDANVKADASDGGSVLLDANVLAQSSGGSKVQLDGDAAMQGAAKAAVTGATEATLSAAGGTVKTSAAGVEASGPKVDINGQTMVTIAGAMVKIN